MYEVVPACFLSAFHQKDIYETKFFTAIIVKIILKYFRNVE